MSPLKTDINVYMISQAAIYLHSIMREDVCTTLIFILILSLSFATASVTVTTTRVLRSDNLLSPVYTACSGHEQNRTQEAGKVGA